MTDTKKQLDPSPEGAETIIINARGEHIEVSIDIVKKYFGIPIEGTELYVNYRAEEVHKVLDDILQNSQNEEKLEATLNDKQVLANLGRNETVAKLRLSDVLVTDEKEETKVNINFDRELFVCDFNFNKVTEKMFEGVLHTHDRPLIVRLNQTTQIMYATYNNRDRDNKTKTTLTFDGIKIILKNPEATIKDAVIYLLKNNLTVLSKFYAI